MTLRYEETPYIWLEANQKQGYAPIVQDENYPAYFLSPEDINAFLHSGEQGNWLDLFLRPSQSPYRMDYDTVAVNPDDIAALFAAGNPRSSLSMIGQSYGHDYRDIPSQFHNLIPQAVYQHELGHFYDPRLNRGSRPYLSKIDRERYKNLKKTMDEKIFNREIPAIKSEDAFWESVLSGTR